MINLKKLKQLYISLEKIILLLILLFNYEFEKYQDIYLKRSLDFFKYLSILLHYLFYVLTKFRIRCVSFC